MIKVIHHDFTLSERTMDKVSALKRATLFQSLEKEQLRELALSTHERK